MKRTVIALSAAALLAGCGVSKQVVAEKDAALTTCTDDLASCRQQLQAAHTAAEQLGTERDAALQRATAAEHERDTCRDQAQNRSDEQSQTLAELAGNHQALQTAQQETQTLQQREATLREQLDRQLKECTVDIERLRGQLRIRGLEQLFFNPASADILPDGKAVLDQIAASLKSGDGAVRVEGHTDAVPIGQALKGKWFSNWELSAARAASVVRYFQFAHDIDPRRLTVVGRAAYQPLVPNDSAENRRRNRRVEIILTQAQ